MQKNAYLDAKIGVDTAENEPRRKSDVSWLCSQLCSWFRCGADLLAAGALGESSAHLQVHQLAEAR